jgi:hypothetical protein
MTVQEMEKLSEALRLSAEIFLEREKQSPIRILSICGGKMVIEVDDNYIKDGRIMTEKTNGYKSKQNG